MRQLGKRDSPLIAMSVTVRGPFRLLASTVSYSHRTRADAIRYYSHIPSCVDSSDVLTVNVFNDTHDTHYASGTGIVASGQLFEGTRGAGADVEVQHVFDSAPAVIANNLATCEFEVRGKLHKKFLFDYECAVVEVNKSDGTWYIG